MVIIREQKDAQLVGVIFECKDCDGREIEWTVFDLLNRGLPACPECDKDMTEQLD